MYSWETKQSLPVKECNLDKRKLQIDYLNLVGSPYGWGNERIGSVDCSGTIRFALGKQGYNLEAYTANKLYEEVFTEPVSPSEETDPTITKAVFYKTLVPYDTPSGPRPAGVIRHVTPVVGKYVVLHADVDNGVELRTAKSVRLDYERRNCIAEWRKLP